MENEKQGRKILEEYRAKKLRARVDFRVESPQKIIGDAIARDYPNMSDNMRNQLARTIVLSPGDKTIKVNDKEMKVNDLSVRVAETIEAINSGTSSHEEYYDWINSGQGIISDMNSDGVTVEELATRNDFLSDLNQREVELMTCLGLYQRSLSDPAVKAKYDFLYQKLQKLREIRSAVKTSTKEVANKAEAARKEEKVVPTAGESRTMKAAVVVLKNYDRLSDDDKKKINLYHGSDYRGFNFHDNLRNHFLYNGDIMLKNRTGNEEKYETSPLEGKLLEKYKSEKSVAMHIQSLRGRVNKINPNEKSDDNNKYNSAFMRDRFKMLISEHKGRV